MDPTSDRLLDDVVRWRNDLRIKLSPDVNCNFNSDSILVSNYDSLCDKALDIATWANDYNYGTVRANGWWTLVMVIEKFGKIILRQYRIQGLDVNCDEQLVKFSRILLVMLDIAVRFHNKQLNAIQDKTDRPDKEPTDNGESILVVLLKESSCLTYKLDSNCIYGQYTGFWLEPGLKRFLGLMNSVKAIIVSPLFGKLLCLLDNCKRGQVLSTVASRGEGIELMKILWNAGNLRVLRFWNRLMTRIFGPNIASTISVPRQTIWIISKSEAKVTKQTENGFTYEDQNRVRCRLLWHKPKSGPVRTNDSVILHSHGGGFISSSPETHETYLRKWSKKIADVPIISIDYSLSPKARFPTALQEALDVYLWLLSKSIQVKKLLGYCPKNILICGDSAGGLLMTSLCVVLTDMRKQDPTIALPVGLTCMYSSFVAKPPSVPSFILSLIDPLITTGFILTARCAYLGLNFDKKQDQKTISCVNRRFFIDSPEWFNRISWYRSDVQTATQAIETMEKVASNAYASPLLYDDYESMSAIKLNLLTTHFDPLLDQSILMAKKWKGPITLDVVDDLSHGFLNFTGCSRKARDASELCAERIRESLEVESHNDSSYGFLDLLFDNLIYA